ncbi:AEC family transporter [Sedimenticola sp.]|uniref:AEC family transporter n=1 Tax=Sedimenticola sp. TaxID=1940285 RepID=UPI002583422B|nr:AEC family transporter [Sedimenticola sp.]MCW8904789.1 AEC family transporter [Sedimenticola sp.]
MIAVFNALVPVIAIILLGMLLRRTPLFTDESWLGFENLCYFVLFPALLIKTLATARIASTELLLFSAMVLFAIFGMSLLLLLFQPLMRRWLGIGGPAFTSLFQGATRWHGFIALSIVGLLYGDEGVAYMAIIMAVIIPPLNVINVTVLARFTDGDSGLGNVLRKLLKNPFIIACVIGAVLNLTGIGLPSQIFSLFDILGGGALGLGLLTVGAGLHFSLVLDHRLLVSFGAAIRLLGMPMLMFLGAWLFGIEGMPRTVAVIAAAVPTASTSYILARQMGGDAPLMANLITVQVIVAAVTLPMMIWLAGY